VITMTTNRLNQRRVTRNDGTATTSKWKQKIAPVVDMVKAVAPTARRLAAPAAATAAVVITLGLTACGGDEQESSSASPTPAAQKAAPDAGPAKAPVPDGGPAKAAQAPDAGSSDQAEKAAPAKQAALSGNVTKTGDAPETQTKQGEKAKKLRLVFVPAEHGYAMDKRPGSAERFLEVFVHLRSMERRRQLRENQRAQSAGKTKVPYPNYATWQPTEAHVRSPGWTRIFVKRGVLVDKTRSMYMSRYGMVNKANSDFMAVHKSIKVRTKSMTGGEMTLDELFSRMANKSSPRSPHYIDTSVEGRADAFITSVRERAIALAVAEGNAPTSFTVFDSGTMQKAVEEALPEGVETEILTDRTVAFERWVRLQTVGHIAEHLEPRNLDLVLGDDTLRTFLLRYAPTPASKTASGLAGVADATTREYDLVLGKVNMFVEVLRSDIPPSGTLDLGDPVQRAEIEAFASNKANGYLKAVGRSTKTPATSDTKTAPGDVTKIPTKVGDLTGFMEEMEIPPAKHADVQEMLIIGLLSKARVGRVKTGKNAEGKATYVERYDFGRKSAKRWMAERGLEAEVQTTHIGGQEIQKLVAVRRVERSTKRQNRALKTELDAIVEFAGDGSE